MRAGLRAVATQSAALFAARIAGAAIMLAAQAAIARYLGAETLANYFLLIAAINLLAMAMPLGFQSVGQYFAADYAARGDLTRVTQFSRRAYAHVAAISLAAPGLFALTASNISVAVSTNGWAVIVMAAASAIVYVNGAVLTGLNRASAGIVADALFRPMAIVTGLSVAFLLGSADALHQMLWIAAAIYAAVAVVQTAMLQRILQNNKRKSVPTSEVRRWWRMALPAATVFLVADFFFDIHYLMLAPLLSAAELAVFGVATRIFVLFAFALSAVQLAVTPGLVQAKVQRNRKAMAQRIAQTNFVSLCAALTFCGLALVSGPVLAFVFGESFRTAATPLAILCLILVARSLLGPALLIFSIREKPEAALPAAAAGVAILAAATWLLVPPLGALGAAIAALIAMTAGALTLSLTSAKLFQIDVSVLPMLRALFARRAEF